MTPFLGMLNDLVARLKADTVTATSKPNSLFQTKLDGYDIRFLVSTREPAVVLDLLSTIFSTLSKYLTRHEHKISIDVFSHQKMTLPDLFMHRYTEPDSHGVKINIRAHSGRIDETAIRALDAEGSFIGRTMYMCGSAVFEHGLIGALETVKGLPLGQVKHEGFGY